MKNATGPSAAVKNAGLLNEFLTSNPGDGIVPVTIRIVDRLGTDCRLQARENASKFSYRVLIFAVSERGVPYSKSQSLFKIWRLHFIAEMLEGKMQVPCVTQPRTSLIGVGRILVLAQIGLMFVPASAQIATTPTMEPSTRLSASERLEQTQLDGHLRSREQILKIRERAEAGSPRDQFLVGYAYSKGVGEPQDLSQALAWYLKAANRAEPAAITELGRMYVHGVGVRQDYQRGLDWLLRAAADGYAPAQTDVGLLYFEGLGVGRDYENAIRWWEKAASQRYAPAESNLGVAYLNGMGVPLDPAHATRLFRNAANAGLETAQFDLASCYEVGQGVPQDFSAAAEWYRKAAQQGNSGAQNNLASMYQSGHGVPQDTVRALRLFLLAAENGNMKASINLANTFRLGIGVKADAALSYMWLQIAADGGEDVGNALYRTGLEISERQLDQARQQASAWRAQHHLEVAPSTVASSNSRASSTR